MGKISTGKHARVMSLFCPAHPFAEKQRPLRADIRETDFARVLLARRMWPLSDTSPPAVVPDLGGQIKWTTSKTSLRLWSTHGRPKASWLLSKFLLTTSSVALLRPIDLIPERPARLGPQSELRCIALCQLRR